MHSRISFCLALAASFFFTGCNYTFSDGRVPSQYLGQAQQLMGVYTGTFNNRPTTLEFQLVGDQPQVIVRNSAGNDLLSRGCDSYVGLIQDAKIGGRADNPRLERVSFAFDPVGCTEVQGRRFMLEVSRDHRSFDAYIYVEPSSYCGMWDTCTWVERNVHVKGSFRRQ